MNEVGTSEPEPEFGDEIENVTVALGREAVLSCIVDNLGLNKVSRTPSHSCKGLTG